MIRFYDNDILYEFPVLLNDVHENRTGEMVFIRRCNSQFYGLNQKFFEELGDEKKQVYWVVQFYFIWIFFWFEY